MKPKKYSYLPARKRGFHYLSLGVISLCLGGAAVHAAEVSYRFYRFNPTSAVGDTTDVQLSEITLSHRGKKLNLNNSTGVGTPVTVVVTGGTEAPDANEGAQKLVDGNPGTKWYSGELQPVQFEFAEPVTIDSFNFATGNDHKNRTPTRWSFQGSNDGEAWIDLHVHTDEYVALHNRSHFTYQKGFTLGRTNQVAISELYATPAIVAAGTPITVNYATTNSPTSVTVDPGGVVGSGSATTFTPTASGVHTLTAVNAAGTTTSRFNVKVVTPQTVSYRYLRYTPVRLRDAELAASAQLAEFEFYNGATKVPVQSVTNPGGLNSEEEVPENLIDGIVNDEDNQYVDFNKFSPLVFDLGSAQTLTGYQFYTGGDENYGQPVRWTIEGSLDGNTWNLIEDVDADYPTDPGALRPSGVLPFSYVAPVVSYDLTWIGAIHPLWDKGTPNFSGGSGIFSDGLNVRFDDSGTSKLVIPITEVAPKHVSIHNTEGNDYTFGGGTLNATGSFSKSGSGNVVVSSPTATTGKLNLTGGGLILAANRSLGDAQADQLFTIDGGTLVNAFDSQFFHRPLSIGTATIRVEDGKNFVSIGRKNLTGTLTKTGPGSLSFYGAWNSYASASQNYVIEDGALIFGDEAQSRPTFGRHNLRATVKGNGILRAQYTGALGGDAGDQNPGIDQIRVEEGGALELEGDRHYFPTGLVTKDGVAQGRVVLRGGTIRTDGQLESSNNDGTGELATRSVITVEESVMSSVISGGGWLTNNVNLWALDVGDGEAQSDLIISSRIEGYGFVKYGPGNLEIVSSNDYQGYVDYDPETSPAWALPHGTTILEGSLTVNNPTSESEPTSATGTAPVLIAAGATLQGGGQITGDATVGGTISPGAGLDHTDHLTVGNTVLSGSLIVEVDGEEREDDFGDIVGGGDLLTVNGDLNVTGAHLHVRPFGLGATAPSYVLVKYTGDLIGTFATTSPIPTGYELVYDSAAKEIRIEGEPTEPVGYAGWIAATDLTGEDAEASADPDDDGLPNLIEFIVGGDPESSSRDHAPTSWTDASGNLVFEFRRTSASAYLNPVVEYSVDLTGEWTAADSSTVNVEANGFGSGVDKVTVTLPPSLALNGKLFARLKAEL